MAASEGGGEPGLGPRQVKASAPGPGHLRAGHSHHCPCVLGLHASRPQAPMLHRQELQYTVPSLRHGAILEMR